MDPKALYWTGAFLNFFLVTVLATRGVRQIRRGEVARHRRSMSTAASLVGAFLASYALKLRFLGREDLDLWSALDRGILRFHELCVLVMLIGGVVAATRAWKMRKTRTVTRSPEDPAAPHTVVRMHHRAGWTTIAAAVLGLASSGAVLIGMYQRLG